MKLLIAYTKAIPVIEGSGGYKLKIIVDNNENSGDRIEKENIFINLSNYNATGVAEKLWLIGTDKNRTLLPKTIRLAETLFHELCHALHERSGRRMKECYLLNSIYGNADEMGLWLHRNKKNGELVKNDEEAYTITGFYYDKSGRKQFDPISCNLFGIFADISDSRPITQRVFHWSYEKLIGDGQMYNPLYNIGEFLINVKQYVAFKSNSSSFLSPAPKSALRNSSVKKVSVSFPLAVSRIVMKNKPIGNGLLNRMTAVCRKDKKTVK
jgi:hypothetical protein